jgi:hypothetical protein
MLKKNTEGMMSAMSARYSIDWSASYPQAAAFLLVMKKHHPHFATGLEPAEQGGALHTTLVHGNARIENFFFAPFRAVDFQQCCEQRGEIDIAYLLTTSLEVGTARRYECALVRLYHDKMTEHGGRQVSLAERFAGVQACVGEHLVRMAVGAGDEAGLAEMEEEGGRGEEKGAEARGGAVAMVMRVLAAQEAWQTGDCSEAVVARNNGNGGKVKASLLKEQWVGVVASTEAEARERLPPHILAYIDCGGSTEEDIELAAMLKEATARDRAEEARVHLKQSLLKSGRKNLPALHHNPTQPPALDHQTSHRDQLFGQSQLSSNTEGRAGRATLITQQPWGSAPIPRRTIPSTSSAFTSSTRSISTACITNERLRTTSAVLQNIANEPPSPSSWRGDQTPSPSLLWRDSDSEQEQVVQRGRTRVVPVVEEQGAAERVHTYRGDSIDHTYRGNSIDMLDIESD